MKMPRPSLMTANDRYQKLMSCKIPYEYRSRPSLTSRLKIANRSFILFLFYGTISHLIYVRLFITLLLLFQTRLLGWICPNLPGGHTFLTLKNSCSHTFFARFAHTGQNLFSLHHLHCFYILISHHNIMQWFFHLNINAIM